MFRGYAQQVGPQHKHAIITKMVIFFFLPAMVVLVNREKSLSSGVNACLVSILVI